MSRPQGFGTISDHISSPFSTPERASSSKMRVLVGDVAVVDVRISVLVVDMIGLGGIKRPLW